jgi:ribosomal protein S18 acetylase RimI-like enzyme
MNSGRFLIKPFNINYLDEVHELMVFTISSNYPAFYCPEVVSFFLNYHSITEIKRKSEQGLFIIGIVDESVVATGYLIEQEIGGVYVHPNYQRKGYGELIVKRLIEIALSKKLEFIWLHSTPPALKFYQRLGFQLQEELTDFVENNAPLHYFSMKMSL